MSELLDGPERPAATRGAFEWTARIVLSAALAWLTFRMSNAVDNGGVDWLGYPLFLLVVIAVFAVYGILARRGG
jgi:hypothetical protein